MDERQEILVINDISWILQCHECGSEAIAICEECGRPICLVHSIIKDKRYCRSCVKNSDIRSGIKSALCCAFWILVPLLVMLSIAPFLFIL